MNPAKGVRAIGVRPDPLPPEAPVDRVTLTVTGDCRGAHNDVRHQWC
jgi:hypothetical protein